MSNSNTDLVQLPLLDPITIKLTKGYETIVDPIDADLAAFKWHVCAILPNKIYASRWYLTPPLKFSLRLHRVIMERVLQRSLTKNEQVDHIDRNSLNNCRSNLRLASSSQNNQNKKMYKNNTTGFKGVRLASDSKKHQKFYACISVDGERIYLGRFATAEEAYAAYCKAAKELHGEFARLE